MNCLARKDRPIKPRHFFVIGFVATSYLIVFVLGVPAHIILAKMGVRHIFAYVLVGLGIGQGWQYFLYVGSSMPSSLKEVGYLAYGICSTLVAVTFWYFAVGLHNKRVKDDT